ncbi:MAG: hypothetical protein AB2689_17990 [Candidatus Thiodiazotropha taylori]
MVSAILESTIDSDGIRRHQLSIVIQAQGSRTWPSHQSGIAAANRSAQRTNSRFVSKPGYR